MRYPPRAIACTETLLDYAKHTASPQHGGAITWRVRAAPDAGRLWAWVYAWLGPWRVSPEQARRDADAQLRRTAA
jgi:hypothetical protein